MKEGAPEAPGVCEGHPDLLTQGESVPEIAADYPLIERLNAEEELFDLLVKLIEVEMIKRKRKPFSDLEKLIRQIMKETIPPEGVEERRQCMFKLNAALGT